MILEDFIIRMLIVVIIGFVIGIERQITGHSAGLKPIIVIAIGTMAFVSLDVIVGNNDTRMAANIITGIGFLCSGVIFKNGLTVNGLNTSATLWATAGISVLVGYGYIMYGVVAAVALIIFNLILLFVLKLVKPIKFLSAVSNEAIFYINVVCLKADVSKVKDIILQSDSESMAIDSVQTSAITEDKFRVKAKINSNHGRVNEIAAIADNIFKSNVMSVTWEKGEE
ncbi:MAG: MgtC/SapB family protein [Lachnospiraceae bacterium]|nr:MgtC/SapB family protein [Lachnospiraceae bacterium]